MKKSIFTLMILALMVVACAPTDEPTTPSDVEGSDDEGGMPDLGGRELVVASDPFPPYTIVADDASIIGFEPDLLSEICNLVNCSARYQVVAWDGIFAGLAAGEYDLVGGGALYTEERDEIVNFTIPYYSAGAAVVVRDDETRVASPDDLLASEVTTGVMTGDMSAIVANDFGIPEDQLKQYGTVDLQFLALKNGDVDAVIQLTDSIGEFVYRVYDGEMRVLSDGEEVVLLSQDTVHLVTQEDDTELLEALNAALGELIADGTIADLLRKWNMVVAIPE